MTDEQWNRLVKKVNGSLKDPPIVGFIIDSPWLPGFFNIKTIDYYSSGQKWFDANVKAIQTFPEISFLPGFWSEFGMCTEPSAFGSKCIWHESNLPHADKIISDISFIEQIKKPNPKTDGLPPFVIQRLKEFQKPINAKGHKIRFAIARGPLNIASFLMGTTEFMMATVMQPEETHKILRVITDFTIDWLQYQKETFPDIDGILILDDIIGFVGDMECQEYVVPYLSEIFKSFEASIRFFHNDASGLISSQYLHQMGINLFNFSHEHTFEEIFKMTNDKITLMGNMPPRDVLAAGNTKDVANHVRTMVESVEDHTKIIWSCGGGMPPNVPSENIQTFYDTVLNLL